MIERRDVLARALESSSTIFGDVLCTRCPTCLMCSAGGNVFEQSTADALNRGADYHIRITSIELSDPAAFARHQRIAALRRQTLGEARQTFWDATQRSSRRSSSFMLSNSTVPQPIGSVTTSFDESRLGVCCWLS